MCEVSFVLAFECAPLQQRTLPQTRSSIPGFYIQFKLRDIYMSKAACRTVQGSSSCSWALLQYPLVNTRETKRPAMYRLGDTERFYRGPSPSHQTSLEYMSIIIGQEQTALRKADSDRTVGHHEPIATWMSTRVLSIRVLLLYQTSSEIVARSILSYDALLIRYHSTSGVSASQRTI